MNNTHSFTHWLLEIDDKQDMSLCSVTVYNNIVIIIMRMSCDVKNNNAL